MNINGVPDQEGVTEVGHWKDMLSSGACRLVVYIKTLRLGLMFSRAIPYRNVLAGGFVIKWTSSNLLDLSQASLSEPGILQICRHKNSSQTMSRVGSSRILYRGRLLTVFRQGRSGCGGRLVWMTPLIWCFL